MPRILTLSNSTFTIYHLPVDAKIPESALESPFFSVTRTTEELSILLPDSVEIQGTAREPGWACFKVKGPLDFGLVNEADARRAVSE